MDKDKKKRCMFRKQLFHPEALRHMYYHDFKYFWILLKVLGMFPYHIDKKGEMKFKMLSKEMVYSVVVYCAITVPVLKVLHLRWSQFISSSGNFSQQVYFYMMACVMFPHLVIPLSHWSELSTFQSAFKKWWDFQVAYEEVSQEKISLSSHWKMNGLLVAVACCTCIALIMEYLYVSSDHIWEFVAHIYVFVIMSSHMLVLIGQCLRLVLIVRDLRSKITHAVMMNDIALVNRITIVWISLSETIRMVATQFYRMYSHLMLILFILSTFSAYSLLTNCAHKRWNLVMLYEVATLINNNMWLHIACSCGERITAEAGRKFTLHLGKLRTNIRSAEMKHELDNLLNMISTLPPLITLNGYGTVNKSLFITINSTMVTYLIVILQFSREFPSPTDENETNNSTLPFYLDRNN